jgi:hypothetical protein
MWTFGSNTSGKTGQGITEGYQLTPKKVEGVFSSPSKKVVFIAAGVQHSACVTEDGSTYTWGNGACGRLGHGDETDQSAPKAVDGLVGIKAKEVACGGSHTLVLSEDGRVYSFGYGADSQLGHGDKKNRFTPTLIEAPLEGKFVVQVACGYNHSMALTRKGCFYTWGHGANGRLGHGSETTHTTPNMIKGLFGKRVVNISSSNDNSVALIVSMHQSYANKMKAMINDESCSDIVFVLKNGDRVHAMKGLLIDESEYFRAMFRSNMRESRENEVEVRDCSKGLLLLLLEYLYTGGVDVGMDHALDLYVLADRYQVNGLTMQCLTVIERGLTNENAIRILVEVTNAGLGLDDLKDVCMSYVVSNYHKVVMNKEVMKSLSRALMEELLISLNGQNSDEEKGQSLDYQEEGDY